MPAPQTTELTRSRLVSNPARRPEPRRTGGARLLEHPSADPPPLDPPRTSRRRLAIGAAVAALAVGTAIGFVALTVVGDAGDSGLRSAPGDRQRVLTGPAPTGSAADEAAADPAVPGPLVVAGDPPAADPGPQVAGPAPDPASPSAPATPSPTTAPATPSPTTAPATVPTTGGRGQTTVPSSIATSPTTARPTTTARQTTTTGATTTTTAPTTSTASTGPPGDGGGGAGGTVVWSEDFDRLDPSTWRREHSTYGDGNDELQCYRPDNVAVTGGRLILTARTETVTCPNGSTRQVSSGMIRSSGVAFAPGQAIEFRVKLTPADPTDQGGLWPAVWASSWAGSWPVGGELDFLEVMTAEDPTRAMFSMHYAGPDGRHRLQNQGVRGSENFSAAWHTVRFDYGRNGRLRWYLDGRLAFAVDAAETIQGYPAPFDGTIRELKVNLALGGRPGPLAPGAVGSTGATFEVDYIRIIQL